MIRTLAVLAALAASACASSLSPEERQAQRERDKFERGQKAYNEAAREQCRETPDRNARQACEDRVADNSMQRGVIPSAKWPPERDD